MRSKFGYVRRLDVLRMKLSAEKRSTKDLLIKLIKPDGIEEKCNSLQCENLYLLYRDDRPKTVEIPQIGPLHEARRCRIQKVIDRPLA